MDDDRRPWPRPDRPWALSQEWHHVLFLHWPVDPGTLRRAVPPPLEIESREGRAWVTILPFAMRRLRPRGLPALPRLSSFPQLNVRTYVTLRGRPGVFLLRVAVGNPLAVLIARRLFHLHYVRGRVALRREGDSLLFTCRERAGERAGASGEPLAFAARYAPMGPAFRATPASLEHWLSERFCYYASGRDGRIVRGEIDHPPWSLQAARVEVIERSSWSGNASPLAYYSPRQTAFVWRPEPVVEAA